MASLSLGNANHMHISMMPTPFFLAADRRMRSMVSAGCVYSSTGCSWLLMIQGKCNVVPTAVGINTSVGIKVGPLHYHLHVSLKFNANILTVYAICP